MTAGAHWMTVETHRVMAMTHRTTVRRAPNGSRLILET